MPTDMTERTVAKDLAFEGFAAGHDEGGDPSFKKFGFIDATVFMEGVDLPNCFDFLDDETDVPESDDEPCQASLRLGQSLRDAGFAENGPSCWVHHTEDVEVTRLESVLGVEVLSYASGVEQDVMEQFVSDRQSEEHFGRLLLTCVASLRQPMSAAAVPATLSSNELLQLPRELRASADSLPAASAAGASAGRTLTIYTWGVRVIPEGRLPKGAESSQETFTCVELSARKYGEMPQEKIRKTNGMDVRVQSVLAAYPATPTWLEKTIAKIEKGDLCCVSVVCHHGQHRSVAMAEIMKMLYYPMATVKHLTMHG